MALEMKKFLILAICVLTALASCKDRASVESAAVTPSAATSDTDQQLQEIAFTYLGDHRDKYRILRPAESIDLVSIKREASGLRHLKFVQQMKGVPIWRSEFTIHIKQGEVYRLSGKPFPDRAEIVTVPEIGHARAEATATAAVPEQGAAFEAKSRLVILPLDGQAMTLSYLVEVNAGLKRYIYFVDAISGGIIKQLEGMPSQFGLPVN